jgi:hypothetical protein
MTEQQAVTRKNALVFGSARRAGNSRRLTNTAVRPRLSAAQCRRMNQHRDQNQPHASIRPNNGYLRSLMTRSNSANFARLRLACFGNGEPGTRLQPEHCPEPWSSLGSF